MGREKRAGCQDLNVGLGARRRRARPRDGREGEREKENVNGKELPHEGRGLKTQTWLMLGKGHGGFEEDEAPADISDEEGFSADHSLSSGSSGNRVTGLEIEVRHLKGIYPLCSQAFNGFLL